MSRFWPAGVPIAVVADARATPLRFDWGTYSHPTAQVLDRWRVDAGWWRRRAWREYFKLITRSGLLVIVYHDVSSGEWYLQRVYD
jgi:hypothetical protein